MLQYLSDKHNKFHIFQARVNLELKRLINGLAEVIAKVNEAGKAIDDMDDYSYMYQYNITYGEVQKINETTLYNITIIK